MRPILYLLQKDGEVVPVLSTPPAIKTWTEWFSEQQNRQIAFTQISARIAVSTVFLGMNHGFDDKKPVLFETLVFGGRKDGWMNRYATKAEAEAGHLRIVEAIRTERGQKCSQRRKKQGS